MGHPNEVAPSQAVWGRRKWQLTIGSSIHNLTTETISLHDIRAHTYYVTGVEMPLAMMIHRARIELTQDNSIFSDGRGFILRPKEIEQVEFVMETSLFDTLMTTIVFGLFVDYQTAERDKAVTRRLPSDKIYLFQYHHESPPDKAHFVARDRASIRARAKEEPDDRTLQNFCESLEKVYDLHCSHDHRKPLPPLMTEEPESEKDHPEPDDSGSLDRAGEIGPGKASTPEEVSKDLSNICSFFDLERGPADLIHEAFYQRSLAMYDSLIKRSNLFGSGEMYWKIHKLRDGTKHRNMAIRRLVEEGFLEPLAAGASYRLSESKIAALSARTDSKVRVQWLEYAVRSVDALLPDEGPDAWSTYDALAPHARSCLRYADQLKIDPPMLFEMTHHFASSMLSRAMYSEAELFARKALEIAQATFGSEHQVVGLDIVYLAETLKKLDKREEIEGLLKRGRSILAKSVGRDHPDYGVCVHNLGVQYRAQGRDKDAEALFKEAQPILERAFANSLVLAESLEDQAELLRATERIAEADRLAARAVKIRAAAAS